MKTVAPEPPLPSPAKAGDPVLRDVSDRPERPMRTGYPTPAFDIELEARYGARLGGGLFFGDAGVDWLRARLFERAACNIFCLCRSGAGARPRPRYPGSAAAL